jgi:hypothetical protein
VIRSEKPLEHPDFADKLSCAGSANFSHMHSKEPSMKSGASLVLGAVALAIAATAVQATGFANYSR